MSRAPQTSWRRDCPACAEGQIEIGFFDTGRKRVRRCPACGVSIEFVVPSAPYYTWATAIWVTWTIWPFLWFYLAFQGRWEWGAAAAIASLLLLAGANLIFNPMLKARRVDEIPPETIDYQRRFGN